MDPGKEIQSMTLKELKEELRKVGARLGGKKAVLVQRLIDYRRNANFRDPILEIPAANAMPNWPEASFFHSLTLADRDSVPKIREEHVQQYIVLRQVLDRGPNYDHAAFARGKKMMNSVMVLSKGIAGDTCFTSSIVSAEFKDVSYTSRIVVHSSGEVLNSDCDCPTGKIEIFHGPRKLGLIFFGPFFHIRSWTALQLQTHSCCLTCLLYTSDAADE